MINTIKKISIINFKSIQNITLSLGKITLLVGLNGSGKSNIIDSFAFISDCLLNSIDYAIRIRGGPYSVFRQATRTTRTLSMSIDFSSSLGQGNYSFSLIFRQYGYIVGKENLKIVDGPSYLIDNGSLKSITGEIRPKPSKDRLYLQTISGLEQFRPYYDLLSSIRIYAPSPESMRQLQSPEISEFLKRDASNIASVINFSSLEGRSPGRSNVIAYMRKINSQFTGFSRRKIDRFEGLYISFNSKGHFNSFSAYNASDGTLRALGILSALFLMSNKHSTLIIGVEEPETSLHPAAAAIILDAIRLASTETQVIATTHSPDLLENVNVETEKIIYVESNLGGFTTAREINESTKSIVRDGLYNPGELLRMEQLS